MVKALAVACAVFAAGCLQQHRLVEGTSLQLGAYVPWESQLWGLELVSYVSGLAVKAPTNVCLEVRRSCCSTNEFLWGMVKTVEASDSKIATKR